MIQHEILQEHAVRVLRFTDAVIIRMAFFTKIVKRAAHVDILLRRHIKQRQIHGAAAAVPGVLRDI